MHSYLSSSNGQFKSFFNPGSYGFTSGPAYNPFAAGNGFTISRTDPSGVLWTSYSGTGDQSHSSVTIISVTDSPDPLIYYIRVRLQFTCKLYRTDTGEAVQVTNGEFNGLFGKI